MAEAKNVSLEDQLKAKREELLIAKQGLGSTLQNPHRIKALKKEIARILTQINATKGDK
ncbi:MAG: 50S ribosomal protein L29 [Candidatus Saccharibacteria bacterium]|nr:50S ribosomal protein L29 [Candidatus Saccharibacteria bacterium]